MLLFIGRGLHGDCLVFEFQNILCYCLSVAKSVHEPPFLKFQNILCYCLSYIRFIQKELIYISKHLMLLFIFKASCNSQHFSAFQNILCYCLSKSHLDRYVTDYISKHLMLLFIFIFFPAATLPSSISKHLMLLFIPEKIPTSKHSEYFKTSYVIVYPISGIYYPHRTVISKHLMLLFINDADYIFVRDEIISKHLMLLFICSIDSKRC